MGYSDRTGAPYIQRAAEWGGADLRDIRANDVAKHALAKRRETVAFR